MTGNSPTIFIHPFLFPFPSSHFQAELPPWWCTRDAGKLDLAVSKKIRNKNKTIKKNLNDVSWAPGNGEIQSLERLELIRFRTSSLDLFLLCLPVLT